MINQENERSVVLYEKIGQAIEGFLRAKQSERDTPIDVFVNKFADHERETARRALVGAEAMFASNTQSDATKKTQVESQPAFISTN